MKLRLAGGVVAASHQHAWMSRPAGPARVTGESDAPPGAAVVLGSAGSADEQIRLALNGLTRLVQAGGVVAAGAGVDLGAGFRSARLAGARGDQRDAVLAALRVLGFEGASKLGDRAGFLVALFGPAVTKRVGSAAAQAMTEGRWAALHLASAASDMLGPEQLEQVLALTAAEGADLISGGLPSALAGNLRQVLEPLPRPRRLELVIDLWARVSELQGKLARRERLLATQGRRRRVDDLRRRRAHFEDEKVLWELRAGLGTQEPALAAAALWTPPDHYWLAVLNRALHDALAATALLRTAVNVSDNGLEDGLARSQPMLCAAALELAEHAAIESARKVPGLTGLPARPGSYVRDIHRKLLSDGPRDAKFAAYVKPRLARALDYAAVTMEQAEKLLNDPTQVPDEVLRNWAASDLRSWRRQVGYVRPPTEWAAASLGQEVSLAGRLEALDGPLDNQVAADVEVVGDLLWYADLIDALAQLYGHDAALAAPELGPAWLNYDPPLVTVEPLTPRLTSITLAVSGAAQLIALGGRPARGVKTWTAFIDSLQDAGPALGALTDQAFADQVTGNVIGALATIAGTAPDAALTRLRRLRSGQLANACRSALDGGSLDLVDLWTVSGIRPLDTAIEALDPALRDRFDQLALVLADGSLPASLRKLVRLPTVAPAYSMGLVTRRVRAAIGQLACDDDPVIARGVRRRTTAPLLCALVVAVTCRSPAIGRTPVAAPRKITVPGFPASNLKDEDGPWRSALPFARELGADTTVYWDRIAEHGLQIPTSWLGAGGWPALWSRAHRS